MTTITASRGLDIGRVVSRTFAALQANLGPFMLLSALFVGLPIFLSGWEQTHKPPMAIALVFGLLIFVMQFGGAVLMQGSIITGTASYLDGERSTISDWVTKALSHWWRMFLVSLLVGLLTGVAAMALFVPGLMVATRYIAAVPAQVCEDLRVNASLARSAELTKGRRWTIFALMLLYAIPIFVLEFTLIGFATRFEAGFTAAFAAPATRLLILPVLSMLLTPISAAGVAALYHELKIGREGPGSLAVARVFD